MQLFTVYCNGIEPTRRAQATERTDLGLFIPSRFGSLVMSLILLVSFIVLFRWDCIALAVYCDSHATTDYAPEVRGTFFRAIPHSMNNDRLQTVYLQKCSQKLIDDLMNLAYCRTKNTQFNLSVRLQVRLILTIFHINSFNLAPGQLFLLV